MYKIKIEKMKKILIIIGIALVALITIASIKPNATIAEPEPIEEYVPLTENVTREYVAAIMDEVRIEIFGLEEETIHVEDWMTKSFGLEPELVLEDWMTKPFITK